MNNDNDLDETKKETLRYLFLFFPFTLLFILFYTDTYLVHIFLLYRRKTNEFISFLKEIIIKN